MSDPYSEQKRQPYPEFIKGGKGAGWDVRDSGGGKMPSYTHPGKRQMVVPTDGPCPFCGENHSEHVRLHEQAHVRFTLDKRGRMPAIRNLKDEYFQHVEDMRMDYRIQAEGVKNPPNLCPTEEDFWVHQLKQQDDKGRLLWMVGTAQSDVEFSEHLIRKAVPPDAVLSAETIIDIANTVRAKLNHRVGGAFGYLDKKDLDHIYGSRAKLQDTVKAARWLQRICHSLGVEPDPPEGQPGDQQSQGQQGQQGQPGNQQGQQGQQGQQTPQGLDPNDPFEYDPYAEAPADESGDGNMDGEAKPALDPDYGGDGSADWLDMTIVEPPLVKSLPGRLIRRYSSAEEGVLVGDVSRWITDQRVFNQKRRRKGGVVIVDGSSSVSFSQEEVYAICEALPGVVIAMYGSRNGGELRILAKNGRMVAEDDIIGSGRNGVDGPALAWGGKQQGPRLWISDEQVNGASGSNFTDLKQECDLLVHRFSYKVLNTQTVSREEIPKHAIRILSAAQ